MIDAHVDQDTGTPTARGIFQLVKKRGGGEKRERGKELSPLHVFRLLRLGAVSVQSDLLSRWRKKGGGVAMRCLNIQLNRTH